MGGLWKLAAMSAVIGAGVVVVWQAQQGLQPQGEPGAPTAPALSTAADAQSLATPQVLTPDLTPADGVHLAAANLSVPPEADPFFTADSASEPPATGGRDSDSPTDSTADVPTAAATFPPEARYSRGLDFRRSQELTPATSEQAPPVRAQVLSEEADPSSTKTQPQKLLSTSDDVPLLIPEDQPAAPAVTGNAGLPAAAIQLTGGEDSSAPATLKVDPFSDAAPPDLSAPPSTAPRAKPIAISPGVESTPADEFDPFGTTPAGTTPATEPAPAAIDPFDDGSSPRTALPEVAPEEPRKPVSRPPSRSQLQAAPPEMPAETEPPFDPFAEDPARNPAPAAAPAPLPLDLEPETTPAPKSLPAETLTVDPFDSAAPPEATPAPTRSPTRELRSTPAPLATQPLPANPPASPATPQPRKDPNIYRGDGEIGQDTPRGIQEPRLTIEKIAPQSAVLGQPVVYSVIIKNVGGSPATQVTVEDRIPKGTRLVGTAPQAEMIEKRLVWRKIGTLQPGEERKISIKVIPEEEGPIGSVAKVSFIAEVTAEIVVHAPKLKITVNTPGEAKVGEAIPLVFTISNPGNGDAENVIVRSIIPDGLQHPAGNDLEYTIGTLAAKETREVRLEVTAMKPGRVTPETIVTADGNLTTKAQIAFEIVGEQLLLKRSGQDRVYLGRNIVFNNTVTNEGQRPVNNVRLTETVPEGFDFVSATQGGKYNAADRSVAWNLGLLPPAGSTTASITLVAKAKGNFDATVIATGPAGSTATVKPTVAIEGYPALAVERLGEERLVGIGETLTTKVEVQNRGTAAAKHVGMAIAIPKELRLVSASGPSKYRVTGQRVVFDPLDEMEPRGAAAYELVLEAQAAGDSRLEMEITADHHRLPVRHDEAVHVLADPK